MPAPVITFGATGGFGTTAGWNLIEDNPNPLLKDRGRAMDSKGNEVASKLHNARMEYNSKYQCASNTNTVFPTIGKLLNSRILESLTLSTKNTGDANEMDCKGHNHATNAHTDILAQALHLITCAKAFGAVDFLGGTAGDNASLVSGTITIALQHRDREDGDGAHLIGENYDCMITATTVWTGIPTTAAGAGWDVTTTPNNVPNTDFTTTTVTGTKTLTLATPA